jgi:hypothetical protein
LNRREDAGVSRGGNTLYQANQMDGFALGMGMFASFQRRIRSVNVDLTNGVESEGDCCRSDAAKSIWRAAWKL